MASALSEKLSGLVKKISGQVRITESNVFDMLREVRLALLEADVALPVVRDFMARVKDKALGQEVLGSLKPGQALVGIVQRELAATMGEGVADLNLAAAQATAKGEKGVELVLRQDVFSTKRACPKCGRSFQELDPRLFSYNSRHGWCGTCYGTGLQLKDVDWNDERARNGTEDQVLDSWIDWLEIEEACPACDGLGIDPEWEEEPADGEGDDVPGLDQPGQRQHQQPDRLHRLQRLDHDQRALEVDAVGNVRIEQFGDIVEGPRLNFNLATERGIMDEPKFTMPSAGGGSMMTTS